MCPHILYPQARERDVLEFSCYCRRFVRSDLKCLEHRRFALRAHAGFGFANFPEPEPT